MNRIRQIFRVSRVLLPVIHPVSRDRALAAVEVAVDAGADGVFLIDQGLNEREVVVLIGEVYRRHPSLWVGINLLSRAPAEALAFALEGCGRIDGLWSDNAGIDERAVEQRRAKEFVDARTRLGWNGLYVGGVAFKYQREVPRDPQQPARCPCREPDHGRATSADRRGGDRDRTTTEESVGVSSRWPELPGSLADDNKEIIQRAYLKYIDLHKSPAEAANLAAGETPFVKNRRDFGYRDIEVKPYTTTEKIVYGNPPVRKVPASASIVARRK